METLWSQFVGIVGLGLALFYLMRTLSDFRIGTAKLKGAGGAELLAFNRADRPAPFWILFVLRISISLFFFVGGILMVFNP